MPHWLDRVVPHVSIEGAEFFEDADVAPGQEPDLPKTGAVAGGGGGGGAGGGGGEGDSS
jgi:hypothetical protein